MKKEKKKLSLTIYIFIGMLLGILVGILLQSHPEIATSYIKPFGTIFLNLIKFVVIPVVLFSIIAGVISMDDIGKVGKVGLQTISYYMVTTLIAVTLGILFANLLQVGAGYQLVSSKSLHIKASKVPNFMDTLVNIFPSNAIAPLANASMLQIIVIALLVGFGIIMAGEKGKPFAQFVNSAADVFIKVMGIIIKISPVGVFCLLVPVVAENGPSVLLPLLKLILVVYLVYVLHAAVVYSTMVKGIAHISPRTFFKSMLPAILMAFSSSSSVATIPLNMECTQKMGAKEEISSFVLPLGATINMDGTAIYQGVCSIFIAEIFGIHLTLSQQIVIILTATLASIGTAGVPGSGPIMLTMVLQSVGLPLEGVALVAGIDRILDMGRTTVNITGDAACTMCISKLNESSASKLNLPKEKQNQENETDD